MAPSRRTLAASILALGLCGGRAEVSGACTEDNCAAHDGASLLQQAPKRAHQHFKHDQESEVVRYLDGLVKMPDGTPNPRISCTPGDKVARDYIVAQLTALGVEPLGDNGGYEQLIPGTLDVIGCEAGLANIIGIVRGTKVPDEYVVLGAHHDGPNNQGEFEAQIGNQDTDDAYDNGAACAALLAMAQDFVASPPDYSVVFIFTAAEEGFQNMGVGINNPVWDRVCTATQPLWDAYNNPKVFCRWPAEQGGGSNNFPVGATAFAMAPTFDLDKARVFIGIDPLGAPGLLGGPPLLAVIGSERFGGLRQQLAPALAAANSKALQPAWITRLSVQANYGDLDPFVRAGVPSVWFAQPGFQSYHGGLEWNMTKKVFAGLGVNVTMFWALDRLCSLDLRVLKEASGALTKAARVLATAEGAPRAKPQGDGSSFSVSDGQDAVATYDLMIAGLSKGSQATTIPEQANAQMLPAIKHLKGQVQGCLADAGSKDPLAPLPGRCQDPEAGPVAFSTNVAMALDFLAKRLGPQGVVNELPEVVPIPCRVRAH